LTRRYYFIVATWLYNYAMPKQTFLPKLAIVVVVILLLLTAWSLTMPGASAQSAALPTTRATRPANTGGVAATAAAAATRLAGTASVAATRIAGTAAALATKAANIRATLTPYATTNPDDASDAITSYAASVLGIDITVKKAGGYTGDVTKALSQTPKGNSAQTAIAKLAVTTYGAVLSNGAASLSYGDGTVTGDITVDVQGSSLGVYSLLVGNTGTLSATSALDLAKKTFPYLADFTYSPQTVTKGFAWYAKASVRGYNTTTKKFETMNQTVILYVLPGANGRATVTATVGRGTYATSVRP
jgi:hypothetical protein